MLESDNHKRVEQAEQKARLIEAELNAVKSSKAYKLSKIAGIIKAQIKEDPVGLSKKAARVILKDPKKARHLLRSTKRGAFIAQSVVEQTAKYQEWILLNEPDESELAQQRDDADKYKYRPTISIITPVFDPPVGVLEDLIESVLDQTYTNFELCLGNFGKNKQVIETITKYAKLDQRVKNYTFDDNRGIAHNSNLVLEKTTGEYIALLDHDDTLSPDALFENIKLLNNMPYDFIYSDKDKIDEIGNRFDPLFKPQLSPEMLLNVNYLTHFNVMRSSIVKGIGGWDPETDGAQDWDLFLRVIEKSKLVGHIPKVLYHWRVIESSTAMSIDTKPYALAGQRKAIDKYLVNEKIPATSYHQKTELFLKWEPNVLDSKPIVIIEHSNVRNTSRTIRSIQKVVDNPEFIILAENMSYSDTEKLSKTLKHNVLPYNGYEIGMIIGPLVADRKKDSTVLFLKDNLLLTKKSQWYEDLTGWLSIDGVGAVAGRLVDKKDLIISSGGLITPGKKYFPIFKYYPRYYQSYIGNAEWVRNLSILDSSFFATRSSSLSKFSLQHGHGSGSKQDFFDDYFLSLSAEKRLVITPHVTMAVTDSQSINEQHSIKSLEAESETSFYMDKFGNPNLNNVDPMRLFEDEDLIGLESFSQNEPVDRYSHDATILADTFDISIQEIDANREITESNKPLHNAKSVAWFLPAYDAVYAGLINIFSFANYLLETQKLNSTIYILKGDSNISSEKKLAVEAFPMLKSAKFVAFKPNDINKIGKHDIGIATQWATAFPLAKTINITRKCYFIQDNEVNFYPKGSISSLVELSYRFGFTAIANTEGLLDMYKSKYGGSGIVLKSRVDLSAYYARDDLYRKLKKPYKVFFYARPNMPRNAFELGIAGLKKLKRELGEDVEIVTAGAIWDPSQFGAEGLFTNLGKIDYKTVPKLYRTMDVGLMFMFSGHPGVTASELMATGCPVVVNEYEDKTWQNLYLHEKTCLVTIPTASEICRNLKRCLEDDMLRKKLINGGIKKVNDFYADFEYYSEKAYKALINT